MENITIHGMPREASEAFYRGCNSSFRKRNRVVVQRGIR